VTGALAPLQLRILPRDRVFDGLEMGEHGAVRDGRANLLLDRLQQVVPPLDRPVAGHENVERYETPASRLTRPQGVELDPRRLVVLEDARDPFAKLPRSDRRIRLVPVLTMFTATARATIGSIRSIPVPSVAITPATTATDVQTSTMRCWDPASSAIESNRLPAFERTLAVTRLTPVAATMKPIPSDTAVSSTGLNRRTIPAYPTVSAAKRIIAPSKPLAKYSAFV
jgi:hypothetical protein